MGWKNVNTIIEDKLLLGKFVPDPPSNRILLYTDWVAFVPHFQRDRSEGPSNYI